MVTIGAYDGVHLGHQAVIAEVRRLAAEHGRRSRPSSRSTATRPCVVRPESAPRLLTDLDQKLELLAATGVDVTVVVPFDEQPGQGVAPRTSCRRCWSSAVSAPGRWSSARTSTSATTAAGNVALLRELGRRARASRWCRCRSCARVDGVDEPVSSTAIRRALAGGEVDVAAQLLGRPFEARGIVVTGDQRGRLLGFPTANVEVPNQICLPGRRRVRRLVRAARRRRAPVRHQPRPAADVLRARRPLAARGPPARLRRTTSTASGPRCGSCTSCAASASSTASTRSSPS